MTAPRSGRGGPQSVEMTDAEHVVPHGHARRTWLVRQGDAWCAAASWPGALIERLDAGPGTVWERRIVVELEVGALLMRVESSPGRVVRRSALDHLMRQARRAPRRVRRAYFRVRPGGALERAEAPTAGAAGRGIRKSGPISVPRSEGG